MVTTMVHDYSEQVGEAHRKALGQFFTHPAVARFMVDWVGASGREGLFDPAFGLGAFRDAVPESERARFSAMEVDGRIVDFWSRRTGEDAGFVSVGDYLATWGRRWRNIVCNPPYMRFQKFVNRDAVASGFRKHLGLSLSGYTNAASAFLMKSIAELDEGGRLAYLMPLEFLNTGYGRIVKQRLLVGRHLRAVIRLKCERDVFPDATTSVGMILVDKAATHRSVMFHSVDHLDALDRFHDRAPEAEASYETLDPQAKWLPYFGRQSPGVDASVVVPLQYYGRFRRGIATGANEFFSLCRTEIGRLHLNEETDCAPCITRSAQITGPFFDEDDLAQLRHEDRKVFLFSVAGDPSAAADAYIDSGESRGFHRRHLTRHRRPWYRVERREPAPLLFGVFSRGGYKVVRNRSSALNLTCYHGFVPNRFGSKYLDHLFLYLLSVAGREIVSLAIREYGDSLGKFEPNDINEALAPAPEFLEAIREREVADAIEAVRRGNPVPVPLEERFGVLRSPPGSGTRVATPPATSGGAPEPLFAP